MKEKTTYTDPQFALLMAVEAKKKSPNVNILDAAEAYLEFLKENDD